MKFNRKKALLVGFITAIVLVGIDIEANEFKPYARIGAGLKINETDLIFCSTGPVSTCNQEPNGSSDVSFRFELGARRGNWLFGWAHRSQISQGSPFNNDGEYKVDELFIDYELELW